MISNIYFEKRPEVKAIRFTEENIVDVVKFTKGKGTISLYDLPSVVFDRYINSNDNIELTVRPSQWVVLLNNNEFKVLNTQDFHQKYEEM